MAVTPNSVELEIASKSRKVSLNEHTRKSYIVLVPKS